MNQDTTQPSPLGNMAQFLLNQEVARGVARLVAWAQGKALSHEHTGWPSNINGPNRAERRNLWSALKKYPRRDVPGGTVVAQPKDRKLRNKAKAKRRKR